MSILSPPPLSALNVSSQLVYFCVVSGLNDSMSGGLQLLLDPLFSIPTDNTYILSVTSTDLGRIFMAGKDGCQYISRGCIILQECACASHSCTRSNYFDATRWRGLTLEGKKKKKKKELCVIRFTMTFFHVWLWSSSYVLKIPTVKKAPAMWSEAEKQLVNHPMKRLSRLSELLCVFSLWPLGVGDL